MGSSNLSRAQAYADTRATLEACMKAKGRGEEVVAVWGNCKKAVRPKVLSVAAVVCSDEQVRREMGMLVMGRSHPDTASQMMHPVACARHQLKAATASDLLTSESMFLFRSVM